MVLESLSALLQLLDNVNITIGCFLRPEFWIYTVILLFCFLFFYEDMLAHLEIIDAILYLKYLVNSNCK